MIDLRSYVFLDSLQPQHAAFLGTVAKGFLPVRGQASLFIEISPGIAINRLTDIAVKTTSVQAGHADRRAPLRPARVPPRQAGRSASRGRGDPEGDRQVEEDRIKPKMLSSTVIRHLDDRQTQLINRTRHGHMIVAGQIALRARGAAGRQRGAGGQRGREGGAHQGARDRELRILRAACTWPGDDRDIDVAVPVGRAGAAGVRGPDE